MNQWKLFLEIGQDSRTTEGQLNARCLTFVFWFPHMFSSVFVIKTTVQDAPAKELSKAGPAQNM